MPLPSGEQFEIVSGEQRATIVEVGGGVREYRLGERPVLDPYPADAICDGAHGTPLIPWPNRLQDGRYTFDGREHQLALTEPERSNAIHGLLRWRPWQLLRQRRSAVTVGTRLHPMAGYPFTLDIEISYSLGEDGLTVETTARNIGGQRCPYGAGQHPYLSAGGGLVDDCELRVPARTRIATDEERQLPVGSEPVAGTPYDFTGPRRIGEQQLDDPFTDLIRESGRAVTSLACPDGRVGELWVDEHHPLVEIFTGDGLEPERARRGLGVEPMTCPPNALRTGEDLMRIEPGASVTTSWGVRLV
jgi:aldose 1-epimerase